MIGTQGYKELRRHAELDPAGCLGEISESLATKELRSEDFSIRGLAEAFLGHEWMSLSDPRKGGGYVRLQTLSEAAGSAVTAAMFKDIIGQVFFNKVQQGFESPMFALSQVVPDMPSGILGPEIVPGITEMGDGNEIVGEGEPYPFGGVAQDYIELPAGIKRGRIIELTREAIFADQTGLLLMRALNVGKWLGFNKECRVADGIIDENTTAHRYKWRGTSYATYQSSTPWINLKTSNALENYTDLDNAEQLFENMTDPTTSTPVMVAATHVLVPPSLGPTIAHILTANGVQLHTGGYATSGNLATTLVDNKWSFKYTPIVSKILAYRMATKTHWYLCDPSQAWVYKTNWPLAVASQMAGSDAEFERDILIRYKANERGSMGTLDPRFAVKSTVA